MNPKTSSIALSELTIHPILKGLHRKDNESDEFVAFVEDIRVRGVQEPVKVDSENRIIDGRHRYWASKQIGLRELPVVIVPQGEVVSTVVQSLLQRRHYSKGARAYMIVPFFKDAFEEARARHRAFLASGGKAKVPFEETVAGFAAKLGISDKLLTQAQKLHNLFTEKPELKKQFEASIFDPDKPAGLGGILAGISGKDATDGNARNERSGGVMLLFGEAFDTLRNRAKAWAKFDTDQQLALFPKIRTAVAAMPPDLRARLKKFIVDAEKEERAEG